MNKQYIYLIFPRRLPINQLNNWSPVKGEEDMAEFPYSSLPFLGCPKGFKGKTST
jgi:hypothetical protein